MGMRAAIFETSLMVVSNPKFDRNRLCILSKVVARCLRVQKKVYVELSARWILSKRLNSSGQGTFAGAGPAEEASDSDAPSVLPADFFFRLGFDPPSLDLVEIFEVEEDDSILFSSITLGASDEVARAVSAFLDPMSSLFLFRTTSLMSVEAWVSLIFSFFFASAMLLTSSCVLSHLPASF